MRGGTSKGAMFNKNDLPKDREKWDEIFLKVMGGPDPKQIDGLGGTVSSNNKILVVSLSGKPGVDVEYLVAQVVVGKPLVDYSANCGNMTSAVGPYAIDRGFVKATGTSTKIRMLNLNTDKLIEETIPTRDGKVVEEGDCSIAGIDGTGAELKVSFLDPAGSKTGKLLPSGSPLDELDVEGVGKIPVSVIDISNVFVFVRGADIGVRGDESPAKLNGDAKFLDTVERIRGVAAQKIGMVANWRDAAIKTAGSPKLIVVSPALDYADVAGKPIKGADMDFSVRVVSVGAVHKATPVTAAVAMGGAAFIEGGVLTEYLRGASLTDSVRIGHPSGTMKVYVDYSAQEGQVKFSGIAAQRTARKIMEGIVYVKDCD